MKKIFLTAVFFWFCQLTCNITSAQLVSPIQLPGGIQSLENNTAVFIDSATVPVDKILQQRFLPLNGFSNKTSPIKMAGHLVYIRFSVLNKGRNTAQYFYFPGKLFSSLQLYIVHAGGKLTTLKTSGLATGFIPLNLPPGQTSLLLKGRFFKTPVIELNSVLISPDQIANFKKQMYGSFDSKKIVGILLSGMLLMMILVTLLNYFITHKIEFFL